jgi:hypothetical protein
MQPRWDRINSAEAIGRARRIYYAFLERCSGAAEPLGVVMAAEAEAVTRAGAGARTDSGRVVFELPVLLPSEQFIPLELVRGRAGRNRPSRSAMRN